MPAVPGTQGYTAEADHLFERYEAYTFEAVHTPILPLLPTSPAQVIDIGAGTGRDAAWFASQGHDVVAVEPTDALRLPAMELHPSPRITWLADHLPELETLGDRSFDVVMLSAVWMHLDAPERRRAMERVAQLLAPSGLVVFMVRHGPVPPGRRMFEVSSAETVALGEAQGLQVVCNDQTASRGSTNQGAGVTWTRLAFRSPSATI